MKSETLSLKTFINKSENSYCLKKHFKKRFIVACNNKLLLVTDIKSFITKYPKR